MDGMDTMLKETAGTEKLEICPGDVVELAPTATYYDGRIIPSWVKAERWIVNSVDGDRVVLNKNVSGTHAIQSPVHKKNVKKRKGE